MSTKHHTPLALAYAQSLLDLAIEQNAQESAGQELCQVVAMLADQPQAQTFMESPGIGADERAGVIEKSFKGQVSPLLYQFMQIANRRSMAGELPAVSAAYDDLLKQHQGKIEVDVTVPSALDDAALENVRSRVSQSLGKQATIRQSVDESIIGGMILKVGDKIIDASVIAQLNALKQTMLSAATKHRAASAQ